MGGIKLGMDGKLYHGTAGATATTELDNIKDLALNLSKDEGDTTSRATGGFKTYKGTLKDVSIEFQMNNDSGTGYLALRGSYISGTAIAIKCVSATNGEGIDGDFEVFDFSGDEPLAGVTTTKVVLKPVFVTRAPVWIDASGGGE